MKCERCGCDDKRYFYEGQCRNCFSFSGKSGGVLKSDEPLELKLPFELSDAQKACAVTVWNRVQNEDVLVHAVCGAGKTELMYHTIQNALDKGMKLGMCIARRQVVLQLKERLASVFTNIKVTAVCEGFTEDCDGHLIILTMHQLFRFHQIFDILIVDEPDAFPYAGNPVLEHFVKQACKGKLIYLTATPSHEQKKMVRLNQLSCVTLFRRPHGFNLPVPYLKILPLAGQFVYLKHWLKKQSCQCLIFVPSLHLGRRLKTFLGYELVYAGHEQLDNFINQFKNKEIKHLICTTVLERGVTFENIHVAVMMANHPVYDEASLVQIAGRVGRSSDYPEGEVLFLCSSLQESVLDCIRNIKRANTA